MTAERMLMENADPSNSMIDGPHLPPFVAPPAVDENQRLIGEPEFKLVYDEEGWFVAYDPDPPDTTTPAHLRMPSTRAELNAMLALSNMGIRLTMEQVEVLIAAHIRAMEARRNARH
jgi:hypothetical protein